MKFELDENLPVELVTDFRASGHKADHGIRARGLRAPDPAVVLAAASDDRILFTLDKGIANLQRFPIYQHAGVVLLRPDAMGRSAVITFVRERLHKVLDLELVGGLTVVEPARISVSLMPLG